MQLAEQLATSLRITEIFYSLQGETATLGMPTIFIRLTGCPLRCVYCDSAYAFSGGKKLSLDDVLADVSQYQARYITVTGGEPLAQPAVHELMRRLCDQGYIVSLETSGALPVQAVDARVVKILDIKTPDSGESSRNLVENLKFLSEQDQIKFVLCSREDYLWAVQFLKQHHLFDLQHCQRIFFSPAFETLKPSVLADWILQDQLPVRFQLQLHKVLWGDLPGK